ncbi:helix-turn-helix domain-containing protein [Trueperella pyogenes]|uniref:helix-turn-helix domain-containing protein n=1 Tax=Trueperella pyogenes TaxID=1661 RepID=UPI00324EBA21
MQDERTVGHPKRDDILQMPRNASPTPTGISDNGSESRENAEAEIRESAASLTSELNELPDGLMDVPQVADYLRVSRTSVYKLIERQKIPAIRIGRLLRVRKYELDETLHTMGNDI